MKKENFDQLYNDVKNGRMSIRQGVELLAQFVCENKPLFKLQCYDDDFASEMILYFLERGEKVFDVYDPEKEDFFKFFFFFIKGLVNIKRRVFAKKNLNELLIFEENVNTYCGKDKYGIKDSYETHMMYSDEKSNYSPVSLSQLQKYFTDKKNNIIDKKILILSLKSCFYISEKQIKEICDYCNLDEDIFYASIQYCKSSVKEKLNKREKFIQRRNFSYYYHRKYSMQLQEYSVYSNKMETIECKNRMLKLEKHHYQNWKKMNCKFEEGFMYLRPTNKTIAELLLISERQVSYYINCAKKEDRKKTMTKNEE